MIAQIRAELLKLRSTRTTVSLVLGMIALVVLFSALTGLLSKTGQLTGSDNQRTLLSVGNLSAIFAALTGILLITGEFRFGTIRPTFLFTPRRSRVISAKLIAILLFGLLLGAVAEGIGFGIGYAALSGRGIHFALHGNDVALLFIGTVVGVALWGAIGVAVGAVVRNQVGAVVGVLAWIFVVENLVFGFVPSVGRFFPARAGDALVGLTTKHLLHPAGGGGILLAWAVAFALAGLVLTARRDVP
jgi:ABC-type transport system involved in multi-copper enzyme maturation permease subunit